MRLFEAFRAGDDKPYYVALPDDLRRPFAESAKIVEAAITKRYGGKFGILQLREMGDITEGGR